MCATQLLQMRYGLGINFRHGDEDQSAFLYILYPRTGLRTRRWWGGTKKNTGAETIIEGRAGLRAQAFRSRPAPPAGPGRAWPGPSPTGQGLARTGRTGPGLGPGRAGHSTGESGRPGPGPVDRENFCRVGETHMWRKASETAKPELAGKRAYGHQMPAARALPMWGGIGVGGFGLVMFHRWRKVGQHEWAAAVGTGKLLAACKSARPDRQRGPWQLLRDNERVLETAAARAAHARTRVELWHIPPRSPDLNPVEKYWVWLRRRLRAMDLADLTAGRKPVTKPALKSRVRSLVQTAKAKVVAKNVVLSLRKTCEEVLKKGGAGVRG